MRLIGRILLGYGAGLVIGTGIALNHRRLCVSQTTLPEPQTHVMRAAGVGPFLAAHSVAIPSDEVNPDTLTTTIGMAIGVLESAVEDEEMAADWECLKVELFRRDSHLMVQVRVKRLDES